MSFVPGNRPPTPATSERRANLELLLLGVLIGLILKGTFDRFLKDHDTDKGDLAAFVSTYEPSQWFQLGVFVFTYLRFVYGAYRYHEEEPDEPGFPTLVLDAVGMFILFIFLYLTGLAVKNTILFYELFIVFHFVDVLWFAVAQWSRSLPSGLKKVGARFAVLDVISLCFLVAMWSLGLFSLQWQRCLAWVAGALFIVIGLADFWWNRDFYFFPRQWREKYKAAV